jgi:hypothetical protein
MRVPLPAMFKNPWFRQTEWVAVLATGLLLDRCYIPELTGTAVAGVVLWSCFLVYWLPSRVRAIAPRNNELPIWILLFVSTICFLRLPTSLGVYVSLKPLTQFVEQHNRWSARPIVNLHDAEPLFRIGAYTFKNYAIENGGIFLFLSSSDGQCCETFSNGIAFKPAQGGSLSCFGAYALHPVFGDWFTFETHQQW